MKEPWKGSNKEVPKNGQQVTFVLNDEEFQWKGVWGNWQRAFIDHDLDGYDYFEINEVKAWAKIDYPRWEGE